MNTHIITADMGDAILVSMFLTVLMRGREMNFDAKEEKSHFVERLNLGDSLVTSCCHHFVMLCAKKERMIQ